MMTYYFDMDGTIADLYGIENWLDYLLKEDTYPYAEAKPLVDCEKLRKIMEKKKLEGYSFGIISWTSKKGTKEYNKKVRKSKLAWLEKYFPDCFSEIHIIKYGTPKHWVAKNHGILFDDEEPNRKKWNKGMSYSEKEIFIQLED